MLNPGAVAPTAREFEIVTPARGRGWKPGLLFWLVLVTGATLMVTPAAAQSGNGDARSVIVRPLSLVNTEPLDFGYILPGATAGTVVVNPNTLATAPTGGVTLLGGNPRPAQFYSYGGPRQYVVITHGPLPTLLHTNGIDTMRVTDLSFNGPEFFGAGVRYLGTMGFVDIKVGGTLQVAANQPEGDYSARSNVTINYY